MSSVFYHKEIRSKDEVVAAGEVEQWANFPPEQG
jgi:hypothetical protein